MYLTLIKIKELGELGRWSLGVGMDKSEIVVRSRVGARNVSLFQSSRLALDSMWSPVDCAPASLAPRITRPVYKADYFLSYSSELKNEWSIYHSSIRLCRVHRRALRLFDC